MFLSKSKHLFILAPEEKHKWKAEDISDITNSTKLGILLNKIKDHFLNRLSGKIIFNIPKI